MLEIAFVFVEVNDPWHRTATTEMLRSAQRVFPGARYVQLCDSESPLHPWADAEWRANVKCTPDMYPEFKNFIVTDYLAQATNPVILSEIDGLWVKEDYNGPFPDQSKSRQIGPGIYISFRDCMDDLVPFARSLDGGEPFQKMIPRTVDLGHIKKDVYAGDPEFGAIEFR